MPDGLDRASLRSLSVLVVEDDFVIAMALEVLLEMNGHVMVGPATSVDSALKLLDTARPDAALLDMNLRGKSATPVARRLQSLGVPFVVTSADRRVDFDGLQFATDVQHLVKPFDEARLLAALHRAVA